MDDLAIEKPNVIAVAVLEELFAMVGGDEDDCPWGKIGRRNRIQDMTDGVVAMVNRGVVVLGDEVEADG